MKAKFFLIALAALCLASCNKEMLEDHTPDLSGDGSYKLEIIGLDATKSSPSTVKLSLANLTGTSSKDITAQLKKKSGSSWVNVTSGVSYAWSSSSSDSKKFSGSGTVKQTCTVSALAAGDGTITVAATYGGSQVASQDVPVSVSDGRALSWTDVTTSLPAGEVKNATLNSNFSCTATISSDNSSFLVGTSSSSLSSSTTASFGSNTTKTIYYKYTGSNETTIKMDAVSAGIGATCTINASAPASEGIDYTIDIIRNAASGYTITVYTDANRENLLCTAGCTDSNYGATYNAKGKTTAAMTPDNTYYITVTRIFGSTTATVMNYNGTKLFDTSGSITYGPIDGSKLLFSSGGKYKLSLTLTAK